MLHVVERLEQALCRWETICFLGYALERASRGMGRPVHYPIDGPLPHGYEFRKYLLSLRHHKDTEVVFDKRFVPSYEFQTSFAG